MIKYHQLTQTERYNITALLRVGRNRSDVASELRRTAATWNSPALRGLIACAASVLTVVRVGQTVRAARAANTAAAEPSDFIFADETFHRVQKKIF